MNAHFSVKCLKKKVYFIKSKSCAFKIKRKSFHGLPHHEINLTQWLLRPGCPLTRQRLSLSRRKSRAHQLYTTPTVKQRGGSTMLWAGFAARGTGVLHKVGGIMKENYVNL